MSSSKKKTVAPQQWQEAQATDGPQQKPSPSSTPSSSAPEMAAVETVEDVEDVRKNPQPRNDQKKPASKQHPSASTTKVHVPTDPELVALAELDKKLLVARDRIRMVARGQTPGFYWHGRSGTCKTHTVLAVLDEMGVRYHYHKGNISQGGLLEIMEQHHDEISVLDDLISAILDDKKAVQYLLAALGRQPGKPLPMGYVRQGKHVSFEFTGGIICISNMPVPPKGMLAAFKSRVHTLGHSPSDLMLIGLARHRICINGWPIAAPKLTVEEVNEAINWVRDESKRLTVGIDLRVLFEKAFPDYLAWKNKEPEAHWKDLVTTTLE